MPSPNKLPQQKRAVKRMLDDIITKKSKKVKVAASSREHVGDTTPSGHSTNEADSCSSSALKTYEEVRKYDQVTTPDPTLPQSQQQPSSSIRRGQGEQVAAEKDRLPVTANSDFFYSPMYRRYFGLTPPNPRLYNPRLLEDCLDWYLNVYVEEELPWQWISVGNPQERAKKDEEEAKEEAKNLASTSTTSAKDNS